MPESEGSSTATPTVEQKVSATAGADFWHTVAIPGIAPTLRLSDGPHGLRRQPDDADSLGIGASIPATCFPPAVALSCTWNPGLAHEVGVALALEAKALGVHVLLGPGMNIKRSPLCGRNFEYFSEDPLLTGAMAAAMVKGIQSEGVAATPKHFAVNNQETDRMRVDAVVSQRALREIYLAAFERVVTEAQPWALMTAYNKVNGRYASEHHWLLTEVLRTEWGFDGLVMSDWGAINDRTAALQAGCDLEMPPSDTDAVVLAAIRDGHLDEATLDVACARLTKLAQRVADGQAAPVDHAAHERLARSAATESVVLLENRDAVLPLPLTGGLRIAVIGEFAITPRYQGGGSSTVTPTRLDVPLEEIKRLAEPAHTVAFATGYTTTGAAELLDDAVELAHDSDVVILFLGLPLSWESEGFDRTHIDLPPDQLELLTRVSAAEARLIVVLSNGSAVRVCPWRDRVDALLEGWLLGQAGGSALANLIFGLSAPSGRLSETIPLRLEDTPSYLSFPGFEWRADYAEDVYVGYRYYETIGREVAYPFGYGLTYTTFEYSDLDVEHRAPHSVDVHVTVTNTGSRTGQEVAQVYVTPAQDAGARPAKELRAFQKIELAAGESRRISFSLAPRDFAYWSERSGSWRISSGTYGINVGPNARDAGLNKSITLGGDGVHEQLTLDCTLSEWREDPAGAGAIEPLISAIRAHMGPGAEPMMEMARHVPVRKFANFRMGVGIADLEALVANVRGLESNGI